MAILYMGFIMKIFYTFSVTTICKSFGRERIQESLRREFIK